MKTIMISLSTISGQSLTSTPHGGESSLKVEFSDPSPNMTDKANELNSKEMQNYLSNSSNQFLPTIDSQNVLNPSLLD